MASLTRAEYFELARQARFFFHVGKNMNNALGYSIQNRAKKIFMMVENCIGQIDPIDVHDLGGE